MRVPVRSWIRVLAREGDPRNNTKSHELKSFSFIFLHFKNFKKLLDVSPLGPTSAILRLLAVPSGADCARRMPAIESVNSARTGERQVYAALPERHSFGRFSDSTNQVSERDSTKAVGSLICGRAARGG